MKHFNKILFSLLLLAYCTAVNAQSDLLSANTESVPANIAAMYKSDDKITIGDFIPNQTFGNSTISVKCAVPVNVQVKFFKMDGNMAKQESHSLDKGLNELNIEMNDLESGTYMVQFYSKEGSAVRRFIKENKSTYTSFNSEN